MAATKSSAPKFWLRQSGDRGHAHHGWLKTYHHFPFASYWDPSNPYQTFGALRVINEDRVEPTEGFGTHGHSEYEIFSYIVSGELEHRDSTGNLEIMKRGDIQMTSTGTGVRHSEYNRHPDKEVHFLQIWGKPYQSRLPVRYYNRHFSDEDKTDKIVKVVAPPDDEGVELERDGKGPIPIHAHIRMFASILTPDKEVEHKSEQATVKTLIHNIMTSGYRKPRDSPASGGAKLTISAPGTGDDKSYELNEGDSLYIDGKLADGLTIKSTGGKNAEFVLFEMNDKSLNFSSP